MGWSVGLYPDSYVLGRCRGRASRRPDGNAVAMGARRYAAARGAGFAVGAAGSVAQRSAQLVALLVIRGYGRKALGTCCRYESWTVPSDERSELRRRRSAGRYGSARELSRKSWTSRRRALPAWRAKSLAHRGGVEPQGWPWTDS